MNIVVQDILKQINAGEAETEDIILDMVITTGDLIPKVTILLYIIKLLIIVY